MALLIPELFLSSDAARRLGEDAEKLPGWRLKADQEKNTNLLMNGSFFPLRGFMSQADFAGVLQDMRLISGAFWPAPLTLDVDDDFADRIRPGDDIALRDGQGPMAIMSVTDLWQDDAGTHLGGKVKGLRAPEGAGDLTPNLSRRQIGLAPRIKADQLALPDLDLPADPQRAAMLRGLVARNFGATHIAATDPLLRAAFESVGLVVEAP